MELLATTIPLSDAERAALAELQDVVGYTREGDRLIVTLVDGAEVEV